MVFAEESHAVDVVCAFTPRVDDSEKFRSELEERYSFKMRKYKEFQALSQYTVVPFVVSHLIPLSRGFPPSSFINPDGTATSRVPVCE